MFQGMVTIASSQRRLSIPNTQSPKLPMGTCSAVITANAITSIAKAKTIELAKEEILMHAPGNRDRGYRQAVFAWVPQRSLFPLRCLHQNRMPVVEELEPQP